MGGAVSAQRIIFVCTENSARSQLAEAIWNREHTVLAISVGIAPADELQPRALEVAARRKIDLTGVFPKLVA